MKWEVQLTGEASDLSELAHTVRGDGIDITERAGQYFLQWADLDRLSTHEEVIEAATGFLQILSGASRLALGSRTPIEIANTTLYKPDGKRETLVCMSDTVHVKISETLTITTSDGSITVVRPASPVPGWIQLAMNDASVGKALRLVGNGINDWVSLYRLFEVIASDVGGLNEIETRGWASQATIKKFKHTANSPAASGDLARHGAESTQAPAKPMELSEASALVTYLLHEWLREKGC